MVDLSDVNEKLLAQFTGEKVYLGTHIFQPTDDIVFTSKGLRLVAPHCKHPAEKIVLNIQKSEIVKVVCNFSQKSVLVLYVLNTCGKYIRECLEMSLESQNCGYFSPMAVNAGEKRIMIEAEINEAAKSVIKSIFSSNILEEISSHDTSIIRTQIKNAASSATSANSDANRGDNGDGVCNILIYPPTGKGKTRILLDKILMIVIYLCFENVGCKQQYYYYYRWHTHKYKGFCMSRHRSIFE